NGSVSGIGKADHGNGRRQRIRSLHADIIRRKNPAFRPNISQKSSGKNMTIPALDAGSSKRSIPLRPRMPMAPGIDLFFFERF
ncbi:MAG: hypothetical protein ACAI44_32030, partial [Candidatus Sericytochromatia bacterium]